MTFVNQTQHGDNNKKNTTMYCINYELNHRAPRNTRGIENETKEIRNDWELELLGMLN